MARKLNNNNFFLSKKIENWIIYITNIYTQTYAKLYGDILRLLDSHFTNSILLYGSVAWPPRTGLERSQKRCPLKAPMTILPSSRGLREVHPGRRVGLSAQRAAKMKSSSISFCIRQIPVNLRWKSPIRKRYSFLYTENINSEGAKAILVFSDFPSSTSL